MVLLFCLGDLLVLGAYSGRRVQAAGKRHHGHRKFMAHIVGSLACLLLGMSALLYCSAAQESRRCALRTPPAKRSRSSSVL